VLAPPLSLALAILAQDHPEADAGAAVAVLAFFAESKQPLANLVTNDRARRRPPFRLDFEAARTEANALRLRPSWQEHERQRGRGSQLDRSHDSPPLHIRRIGNLL
jgi:hypothetical protein